MFAGLYTRTVQAQDPDPTKIQLTQEQAQILSQVFQQMSQEQREAFQQLPPEQKKAVIVQILDRLVPKKLEPIKEFISEDELRPIEWMERERYRVTSERIEQFILKEADRHVDVTSIAFVRDGHDHFFNYKRQYRAKYKTQTDGKEYMADFILQKDGPYLHVIDWRRVKDEQG